MRDRSEVDGIELESSAAAVEEELRLDALQNRPEAESLEEMRSRRIANLVHDLRTPLVSIRGYTKMILEERAGSINSTQREYLTIVSENTSRVIQMLNDLLQLTASEPLHFEPLDLREVWRSAVELAKPRALKKSVRIVERISPEPLLILADRQKLTEVLANLLLNAVKFTERDGEVSAELSVRREREVVLTISDTGVGIPSQLLEKVFGPAAQGENPPAAVRGSISVGLSVVRDLIRLHGGRISATSKVGEGVTFFIALPAL